MHVRMKKKKQDILQIKTMFMKNQDGYKTPTKQIKIISIY